MATTRLLRVSSNPQLNFLGSGSSSSGVRCSVPSGDYEYQKKKVKNNNGDEMKKNSQMGTTNTHRHLLQVAKPSLATAGAVAGSGSLILITSEPKERIDGAIFDLVSSLSSKANNALLILFREHFKRRSLKQNIQMFMERGIINCRFFALFAVAGSLLGSVLCFVEGCFLVLQSYFQYFHNLSHKADQGHAMHSLIEATDMFIVGMAMLMFGFGLYTMFVGSKSVKEKGPWLAGSNLFGLFYMKVHLARAGWLLQLTGCMRGACWLAGKADEAGPAGKEGLQLGKRDSRRAPRVQAGEKRKGAHAPAVGVRHTRPSGRSDHQMDGSDSVKELTESGLLLGLI